MPEYMILIYENEAAWESASTDIAEQFDKEHMTFGEVNAAALRGGNALKPTATATSLRRDANGGFEVTDAPFAETKEALGGYYVIEAANLDEALAIAKQVPTRWGGVEVRPIRPVG